METQQKGRSTEPYLESTDLLGGKSKGACPNVRKNKRKKMTKEMPWTNSSKENQNMIAIFGH